MMNRGQLLGIREAAIKGDISENTIKNYIKWGLIDGYLYNTVVYYGDVLQASLIAGARRATNFDNVNRKKAKNG
jgi:hypothetical protein